MRLFLIFLAVLVLLLGAAWATLYTGAVTLPDQYASWVPGHSQESRAARRAARAEARAAAEARQGVAGAADGIAAQPAGGSRKIGDWTLSCEPVAGTSETRCRIYQSLVNRDSGVVVFLWTIAEDGNGGLVATWDTPTNVLLTRGIVLEAGTPQPIPIPYELCTSRGCRAVANLPPEFLDALARADKATVTIHLTNGRNVPLDLSVDGLAAGLRELRRKSG